MKVKNGFTLIEVLIATTIITAFMTPVGFFFYKTKTNQKAFTRYYATQILKTELNRAIVLNRKDSYSSATVKPDVFQVVINVDAKDNIKSFTGNISDKHGVLLLKLKAELYD